MTAMIFSLGLLISLVSALCTGSGHNERVYTIYQFPNDTWVENIAVRKNGNLLVTLVNTPELWEVNPFDSSRHPLAKLIHYFDGATMATGITELTQDIFAVTASNVVYLVNFTGPTPPRIESHTNLTSAGILNGMTTWNAHQGEVLSADSTLGAIWRLNVHNGAYEIVLQDDTMSPRPFRNSYLGINGVKTTGGYVYFNNIGGKLFCRVRVDPVTGRAVGPYEPILEGDHAFADDFAITPSGVAYLAGLDHNVLTRVYPNGTAEVVAGSLYSPMLIGATAAAFGRTERDKGVLYVTTGGGNGNGLPINGTYVEGGKIVAVVL